jgi:hypothetical protein
MNPGDLVEVKDKKLADAWVPPWSVYYANHPTKQFTVKSIGSSGIICVLNTPGYNSTLSGPDSASLHLHEWQVVATAAAAASVAAVAATVSSKIEATPAPKPKIDWFAINKEIAGG